MLSPQSRGSRLQCRSPRSRRLNRHQGTSFWGDKKPQGSPLSRARACAAAKGERSKGRLRSIGPFLGVQNSLRQVSEQGGLALGGVRAEGIGRAEFYKEGQIAIEFALER